MKKDKHLINLLQLVARNLKIYEQEKFALAHTSVQDILHFLMEEHQLTQADLPEIGSQSLVTRILSEKKINQRTNCSTCASISYFSCGILLELCYGEVPFNGQSCYAAPMKKTPLAKKLLNYTSKAINDYQMIQPNDRVLVCLSGGKDSYTMICMLEELRKLRAGFTLQAFTLDQSQPGWDDQGLGTG